MTADRPPAREQRAPTSRVIDQITDALGDEKAFAAAAILVLAALLGGRVVGELRRSHPSQPWSPSWWCSRCSTRRAASRAR